MGEKGRVFTGARARLSVEGRVLGYARNISGREGVTFERVKGLGNIRTLEFAPTSYDTDFSLGWTRLVGETLKQFGFVAKAGQNAEEHLRNILAAMELTVSIEDVITKTVTKTIEQCVCGDISFSIDAVGVVMENTSWMGIVSRDESEA
jgi:hypothetical protein